MTPRTDQPSNRPCLLIDPGHPRLSVPVLAIALAGLLAVPGCGGAPEVEPAPPPKRPKEIKVQKVSEEAQSDCEPIDPKLLPPSVAYVERSIDESQNLANQGFTKLTRAEEADTGRIEREELINSAVDNFITALRADPYNVHATYNLAAAYARIDRPQCAINMLERLVNLRRLRSQKDLVEAKLDRLFGRGKYRRQLDPDFREMRDMEIFRDLVKKFCPSLPTGAPLDQCR